MRFALTFVLLAGCAADGLPSGNGVIGGGGPDAGTPAPPSGGPQPGAPPDMSRPPDGGGGIDGGNGDGGTSTGLFKPFVTLALPSQYSNTSALAIGDVTGDGRADLVITATDNGGTTSTTVILVYPQTAPQQLGPPVVYKLADGWYANGVALGDLNGDGRLDVIAARHTDLGILYQNAAGTLDPVQPLPTTKAGNEAAVALADLDGDGRLDIVAAGGNTDVDVWYQTAHGLAGPRNYACPAVYYQNIAVADLDGDGHPDVALAGSGASSGCLLRQAPGGFAPSTPLAFGQYVEAMAVGDLTGDGRADIFVVGGGNKPMSYAGLSTQSASGMLGSFQWMSSYDIPGDVLVADVDEDGRGDAVVVHTGWNAIGLYRQTASGTLGQEELVPFAYINGGTNRMAIGDIDGDGHPDIAVVDYALSILYHR